MTNEKSQALYTRLYWIFTTCMLLSAMPLGIVLILVKLFERRNKRRTVTFFHPASGAPTGAQTTRRLQTPPVRDALDQASKKMRRRTLTGGVLFVLCLSLMALCAMNGIGLWMIFWCTFCSAVYFYTGLHTLFSVSRFRDYVQIMEKKPIMTVAELAARTGLSEKQIRSDWGNVEFMDLLPGIFWDRKQNTLFCF